MDGGCRSRRRGAQVYTYSGWVGRCIRVRWSRGAWRRFKVAYQEGPSEVGETDQLKYEVQVTPICPNNPLHVMIRAWPPSGLSLTAAERMNMIGRTEVET